METEGDHKNPRRDFLKTGLAAGAAALAGVGIFGTLQGQEQPHEGGKKVKLLAQNGEVMEVDEAEISHAMPMDEVNKISSELRTGIPGRSFVMVIDLARCRNARKCVTACQKMHYLPEDKEWLQVYAMKDNEEGAPYWLPKTCFHCDNPPCVKVCPVGATFKRDDNLVLIDNDRCIGCKFCMAACPYSTRVFNWDEPKSIEGLDNGHHCHQPYSPETSVPQQMGTVGKCDFCPDMLRKGELPDCVTACPNGVFFFGDKNEDTVTNGAETFRFKQLIQDRAAYRYGEELGTEPNVYYLPPVNRNFPFERGLKDLSEDQLKMYRNVIDVEKLKEE